MAITCACFVSQDGEALTLSRALLALVCQYGKDSALITSLCYTHLSVLTLGQNHGTHLPVSRAVVALVHHDLWGQVLRRATKGVGLSPGLELLHKSKVGHLHIALEVNQQVLRL